MRIPDKCAAVLATSLLAACGTMDQESGEGGKADDLSGTGDGVQLIQARAFQDFSTRPIEVHYGFTDDKLPGWELEGIVEITYSNGFNEPVVVPVPDGEEHALVGFVLVTKDGFREHFGNDLFIDLAEPEGSLVRMPIENGAPFPFAPECYGISIANIRFGAENVHFDGKTTQIYYGFTNATADEYLADNNVAWENLFGEEIAEGILFPNFQHDGGFKGSVRMLDEYVHVPAGKNLVFKPNINKFAGSCPTEGDTSFVELTETKTFFREVQHAD